MFEIKVDDKDVLSTLDRLASISYTRFLGAASQYGKKAIQDRFADSVSPDGVPWDDNRGEYSDWKARAGYGGKPLILTGELREAITTFGGLPDIATIFIKDKTHSRVPDFPWGSTVKSLYTIGRLHEFGSDRKKIPARPFMALSDEDVEYIEGMLNTIFDEALI